MIIPLEWFERISKENNLPSDRFSEFMNSLVRMVNQSEIAIGTGSPEGVVTASPSKLYMDDSGSSGSILYIKKTGTGNTGWVLV